MNLYDAVNEALDDFKDKLCKFRGGNDEIEKVRINGAAYGATNWIATLKYAGNVNMGEVDLINDKQKGE